MSWSWDVTKLRGPDRSVYYDLYVTWTSTAATSSAGQSRPARTARSPKRLFIPEVGVTDSRV